VIVIITKKVDSKWNSIIAWSTNWSKAKGEEEDDRYDTNYESGQI
jgi:hypothetical protein